MWRWTAAVVAAVATVVVAALPPQELTALAVMGFASVAGNSSGCGVDFTVAGNASSAVTCGSGDHVTSIVAAGPLAVRLSDAVQNLDHLQVKIIVGNRFAWACPLPCFPFAKGSGVCENKCVPSLKNLTALNSGWWPMPLARS